MGVASVFAVLGATETATSWSSFRLSEDLGSWARGLVVVLALASFSLLAVELRRRQERRILVLLSGALAVATLAGAVLRPASSVFEGRKIPGVMLALIDASQRMQLPGDGERTRAELAVRAIEELRRTQPDARIEVREFSRGLLSSRPAESERDLPVSMRTESDLLSTLEQLERGEQARPGALVLLSDGRLTRPGAASDPGFEESLRRASAGQLVHTLNLAPRTPRDRSLRSVGLTGSAIAHQPFRLELTVGCFPTETCEEVEVVVRELLEEQPPLELARGRAEGEQGLARLSLEVTLDRAGSRALMVELVSDEADEVPENDVRIVPIQVRRDRLRLLHVAGRPTYDVRALRRFLKSDESIDLISFFILRTQNDQVQAAQHELSLIPFPVDELFSDHLDSFDAVILQDIHAGRYRLDSHFRSIEDYVLKGGGLILVGGPTGFSSGGYANSPVANVLPVHLDTSGELISRKAFIPVYTESGRAAPVLGPLRATLGQELPSMSGTNVLGPAKEGALVLWQHPELSPAGQSPEVKMPVLALGETGDGRSIAISVDGTHQLRFGELGAKTGGRAYADLWEGLLGWLMRDPRYESAQLRTVGSCHAGQDQLFLVDPVGAEGQEVSVTLERLGTSQAEPTRLEALEARPDGTLRFLARQIRAGGYAAKVQVGAAPPTRAVVACELGGEAWSDSRPDRERLEAIARVTGGQAVGLDGVDALPRLQATRVTSSRSSRPLLPTWLWSTLSVLFASLHWIVRRASGHY